jgi:hypothetical protein
MARPDAFDPESFRLPETDLNSLLNRPRKRPPRHAKGGRFLKGPIPWGWLQRAARLPGKALHVALLLWQEAGCARKRTVRFRLASVASLGMHFDTGRRALRALERAGLVTIRYPSGRSLEVTLQDPPAAEVLVAPRADGG